MKKETIVAISLGVLTGVVIAILIIVNNQKNNRDQNETGYLPATITPQITFEAKKQQPLLITGPKDMTSVTTDSIRITGKAPKGSLIIVQSAHAERTMRIKSTDFAVDFELEKGENIIKVTQYLDKTTDTSQIHVFNISD